RDDEPGGTATRAAALLAPDAGVPHARRGARRLRASLLDAGARPLTCVAGDRRSASAMKEGPMATRTTLPPRKRTPASRRIPTAASRRARAAAAGGAAAARAVDRVLSSEEALALLLGRLEAAGWHIEREPERPNGRRAGAGLTPPARAR